MMYNRTNTKIVRPLLAGALVLALGTSMAACSQGQGGGAGSQTGAESAAVQAQVTAPTAEAADVTTVAYLGPAGTYTEEATRLFFGDNDELLAQQTVADALTLVDNGTAAYAVIPQENTIGGPVTDYIDALLRDKDARVVGEVVLPIRQTLMGLPGTDLSQVKTVYSHKQGLAQSAAWLDENLPNVERVEAASTAAAAQKVADGGDTSAVAIAAPGAAGLYRLEVLQNNVSKSEANKTRFYVVSKKDNSFEGYARVAFVAEVSADELPDVLARACEGGNKLVCVHDRPEGSALGTYRYVIELSRENGFPDAEVKRLEGIDKLTYLGKFSSIEA